MTAIIPAHSTSSADLYVLADSLGIVAHITAGLRAGDDPRDLSRWAHRALSEIGVEVGGLTASDWTAGTLRERYNRPTRADQFTAAELADPAALLSELAEREQAARDQFDAVMRADGVADDDLPAAREHYQPAAMTRAQFVERLIATLCALEAQCREAATHRPEPAPAALLILAILLLAAVRAFTDGRERPPRRVDAAVLCAVTLTHAARAPGARASA